MLQGLHGMFSYVLLPAGLGCVLSTFRTLISGLCVVIGNDPASMAEEEQVTALFGDEYVKHKQKVGRFFPELFRGV